MFAFAPSVGLNIKQLQWIYAKPQFVCLENISEGSNTLWYFVVSRFLARTETLDRLTSLCHHLAMTKKTNICTAY